MLRYILSLFLCHTMAVRADNTSVLCPTFPEDHYCDCSYDCQANPSWCSCDEAQECCEGGTNAPSMAPPSDDCEDGKGRAHIGNGKTATCKKLQNFIKNGRDKKVAEICEINDLGPDGEPPANELCKLSCDNCDSKDEECIYLYYSASEYDNNYAFNHLYGSDDCIDGEDDMLCSGDTFTVSPVNLYWDPGLEFFGGIVTSSGSIVNATANEAPIALYHGSIEPKIPEMEVEGKLFWQSLVDWSSDIHKSAITGATGVFSGLVGTATATYSDMPYVEMKICPPEGWDPERKFKELAKSKKRLM